MTLMSDLLRSSVAEPTSPVTVSTTGKPSTAPVSSETTGRVDAGALVTEGAARTLEPRPRAAMEIAMSFILTSIFESWGNYDGIR
jgi:hypothetical protein